MECRDVAYGTSLRSPRRTILVVIGTRADIGPGSPASVPVPECGWGHITKKSRAVYPRIIREARVLERNRNRIEDPEHPDYQKEELHKCSAEASRVDPEAGPVILSHMRGRQRAA